MGRMPIIGTPQRRLEGEVKVKGLLRFTADLGLPQLAHARLVLSTHAHARLVRVDTSDAEAVPGVLAVVTGADLPRIDVPGPDLPLATGAVFFVGQPLAAVVAETEAAAADAAQLVAVEYEPLPAVLDPEQAMRDDAPEVLEEKGSALEDAGAHGTAAGGADAEEKPRNVQAMSRFHRGDAHAALAEAEVVVARRYEMAAVHQGFIEPHVSAAAVEPDGSVTIHTATQGSFLCRATVARMLKEPSSRFRVVPMPVGGGFGGKICLLEPLAVLLARRVGRPVQVELTRNEEFLMGRGGPGSIVDLKLGARRDGTLTALWARVIFDNGASAGGLGGFAAMMLGGAYRVPNLDLVGSDVATHKTPVGAYRAPGAPQAFFALESAMDELAALLSMDPVELRLKNASREGDPKPDGTAWPAIGLVECLEAARSHPVYTRPTADGEAVGVAAGAWGGGREPAAALCKVEPDGSLRLQLGSQDISGTDTTLAMIAAQTFGTSLDKVRVESGDTGAAPYAGMAGGSKITYTVGPAVQQAAAEARRQLLEIAAEEMEADVRDLYIEDGEVRVTGVPGRTLEVGHLAGLAEQFLSRYLPVQGQGRAAITEQSPMFTVHLARVRVDRETGAYSVTGYAAIQDVGRALNPPEVEGQIHGGVVQGLGRALGEEMFWDAEGQLRNASFLDYGLPSIDQVPEIEVGLVEVPSAAGPFGAKGVGEPPAVPGPAAVANAVFRATGQRLTRLPIDRSELIASPVPAR
jgi:CO/xanthine dehydrogenase Mo-binding subunit